MTRHCLGYQRWLGSCLVRESLGTSSATLTTYDRVVAVWMNVGMCPGGWPRIVGILGIQDAPRKRRAPSQTPGAWAGSNVVITPDGLAVTVSTEKWERTQGLVAKWARRVEETKDVNVKEFESDLGFLIYVSRTFPSMKPYLKGFHLTLMGGGQIGMKKVGR